MVNHARWDGVAVDVGHQIGANDHRHILLIESVDHRLQRVLVLVHVIAVELHNELAGLLVMSRQVPVATDTHVIVVGDDVNQARVVILGDGLASAVGREVVHHHEVELEGSLLLQHTVDGIADGADAVAHRNHHRSLDLKVALVKLDVPEVGFPVDLGSQVATYLLEMLGAGGFHLNLPATIARVDIVENLLAALARVKLDIAVEILVDVADVGKLRQLQAQVIQAGVLIVGLHRLGGLLQAAAAEQQHRPEVKVVAQRALLVVDHRSLDGALVGDVVVVGIKHARTTVVGQLDKSLDGKRSELERVVLGVEHGIVALHMAGDGAHGLAGGQVLDLEHLASLDGSLSIVTGQQIDVSHQALGLQVLDGLSGLLGTDKRDKAINSFHYVLLFCFS